jgi:Domain of unknown function (DUF4270)
MKNIWTAFVGLAVCLTIAASCNKTSLIGAELFENDKLNLKFTDSLKISALNEAPTRVVMMVKGVLPYDNLSVGNVPDAFFGSTESSIYANFGTRNNQGLPTFLSVPTAIVDSVRLIMPYTPVAIYGDTMTPQKLVVYRLTDELVGDTIYSDQTFRTEATPLGSLTFTPKPSTPIQSITSSLPTATVAKSDTAVYVAHVSIPLDINLGKKILALDTMPYRDTTTTGSGFNAWLKGIVIKAETPANCMLNFNMGTSTGTLPAGVLARQAGIYVYFRNSATDTARRLFVFSTGNQNRYANYKDGFQNGKIKNFIGSAAKADTTLCLKSLGGSVTRLEFSDLKTLGNVVINKAELAFTIQEDGENKVFTPIDKLYLLYGTANIPNGNLTRLSPSSSALSLIGTNESVIPNSDGVIVTENGVRVYKMDVTEHLQRMLSGAGGTQLYLAPGLQYIKAGRVILYGPKHPKYRAKLNVFYTKV